MAGGETSNHIGLKALALAWAQEQGMYLAAPEVSFPHRRFRVDVAACCPARKVPSRTPSNTIGTILKAAVVFECKQVRSDLIKDNKKREPLSKRLATLEKRRKLFETRLHLDYPNLALGESLFPEFDSYRLHECSHYAYRKLKKHISIAKRGIIKATKFDRLLSYRLANLHYLVVEEKLLKSHEVPTGWGLLVRTPEGLQLVDKPTWQDINVEHQLVFLQRIAAKKVSLPRPEQIAA
jgi:hypothetical protein